MSAVARFGFSERSSDVFVVDSLGNVVDMGGDQASTPELEIPGVASGLSARGRSFGDDIGLQSLEANVDALRVTRSATAFGFVLYSLENASDGDVGTITARGRTGSAAERLLFGVQLERVDATTARIRARWEELGGVSATLAGATFTPTPGEFFFFAVVRRWLATDSVEVSYYVNDELVGSELVADGDIGEGEGGTFTIGCAGDGAGGYDGFLPSDTVIDSLELHSEALSAEELRQAYRLETVHKPAGYAILRSYLPPGVSWSRDPDSSIQRWIQAEGDALGLALSQVAKLDEDFFPDRAYGKALESWERLVGLSPKPLETIEERRSAVQAALRKVLGFSPASLANALGPLLGLEEEAVSIFEFGCTREDDFSADDITSGPSFLWRTNPGNGSVAIATGACALSIGAATPNCQWYTDGTDSRSGAAPYREVCVSASGLGQVEPYGAVLVAGVDHFAGVDGANALSGLFFRNAQGDAVFFGIMGSLEGSSISSFSIINGVRSEVKNYASASAAATIFLRYAGPGPVFEIGSIEGDVSTVYNSAVPGPGALEEGDNKGVRWGGVCCVSTDEASAQHDASVSSFQVFEPNSERALRFLVWRDAELTGAYDLGKSQAQLDKQKPTHTEGIVSTLKHMTSGGMGRLGVDMLCPWEFWAAGVPEEPVEDPPLTSVPFHTPLTSWKTGYEYFSSPNATSEWTIGNTPYSSGYAPNAGTATLETYLAPGITGQVAPDVYTEAGFDTCGAWEAVSTNDKLEADNTTTGNFDHTSEDFCFRLVFRIKGSMPNSEYLLTKWVGGKGWRVYTASSGEWYFGIKDDLGNFAGVAAAASSVSGATYDDGAVHYITGFVDSSTGNIYTKGDLSPETSASIAAVVGSIATTTELAINGYATNTGLAGWQCLYAGIAKGPTAAAMYSEDFWQHAGDPTGLMSSTARAGAISGEVAPGVTGHVGAGNLAIFYDSEWLSGAGGLALHPNPSTRNLLPDSEDVSAWAASSATRSVNVTNARDGFFSAGSITATADNQIQRMAASSITVVDATEHTLSAYVKRNGAFDVIGALRVWHGGYVATEVFTATSEWQLVSVTWISTSTAMEPYLRLDTNTESVIIHECQINLGSKRGHYVRTRSGARTLPASDYQATINIQPSSGEIEFDFIPRTGSKIAVAYRSGAGSADRRDFQQAASGAVFNNVHNDAGAGEGAFSWTGWTLDAENKHRLLWDSLVGVDGREAVGFLNGVRSDGDPFAWEGTATPGVISDIIRVGSSGASYHLDGAIREITIYDAPNPL